MDFNQNRRCPTISLARSNSAIAGSKVAFLWRRSPVALFNHVAAALSGKGLAYLHVVEGDLTGKSVGRFDYGKIKALFGGPYVANNGYDKVRGQAAVAEGKVDAVAFGKPFIANPDLATRFLLDAPLTPFDGATLYGGDEKGYTDYPILTTVARAASMANINRMESCSREAYDQV